MAVNALSREGGGVWLGMTQRSTQRPYYTGPDRSHCSVWTLFKGSTKLLKIVLRRVQ